MDVRAEGGGFKVYFTIVESAFRDTSYNLWDASVIVQFWRIFAGESM